MVIVYETVSKWDKSSRTPNKTKQGKGGKTGDKGGISSNKKGSGGTNSNGNKGNDKFVPMCLNADFQAQKPRHYLSQCDKTSQSEAEKLLKTYKENKGTERKASKKVSTNRKIGSEDRTIMNVQCTIMNAVLLVSRLHYFGQTEARTSILCHPLFWLTSWLPGVRLRWSTLCSIACWVGGEENSRKGALYTSHVTRWLRLRLSPK